MHERYLIVEETDLDFNDRSVFDGYLRKLFQKIESLEEGGTLYVDLSKVEHMAQELADRKSVV